MSARRLQAILSDHGDGFSGTDQQQRILRVIRQCRTPAAGTHQWQCLDCGETETRYNSCRNRHCPICQGADQAAWVRAREAELLPVPYFHVVFTLPHDLLFLRDLAPAAVYGIIMRSSIQALQDLAADPRHLGATLGIMSVLHTWGGDLQDHPHVHHIVTGGGLDDHDRWVHCRVNKKKKKPFLLDIGPLRRRYRGLLLRALRQAYRNGVFDHGTHPALATSVTFNTLLGRIGKKKWTIYAKAPFGSPQQVLRYLGRYTHRVALTVRRIIAYDGTTVTVRCKDTRTQRWHNRHFTAPQFIRRFARHILPPHFRKIRMAGFLGPRVRAQRLATARHALERNPAPRFRAIHAAPPDPLPSPSQPTCPRCGSTTAWMTVLVQLYRRDGTPIVIIPQRWRQALQQRKTTADPPKPRKVPA